jgi:hypothetical protein
MWNRLMPRKKTRIGRTPKRPQDKQSEIVQVSFTPPEFKRLVKIADGRPLATFVRSIVLKKHPELQGQRKR